MNETNFKTSLSIYLEEFDKLELKEITEFIFKNTPVYKNEFKNLERISKEKGIQFKSQYKFTYTQLIKKIQEDKFEDKQFQEILIQILNKILEKNN